MVTLRFKNKEYHIVPEQSTVMCPPYRSADAILTDFEYCKKIGDYQTIKNRITNGLHWGWIVEVTNNKKL